MEIDLTDDTVLFDDEMLQEEDVTVNMDIPESAEKSPEPEEEQPVTENALDYFSSADPTVLELARVSWSNQKYKQRYLRGCSWSPDGTCLCTVINSNGIQVFELPLDLYPSTEVSMNRPVDIIQPVITIPESGTVYDFAWYPLMDSLHPETCCLLVTRQNEPIQSFDAFDGSLRCSYRGYDSVDEIESAISVCFSCDGATIYGGYKKSIKIFDTNVPGRTYQNIPQKNPASCIANNNLDSHTLAVGSWNCSIHLLDTRQPSEAERLPEAHKGGITQLKFSYSGQYLYSGARKDKQIIMWDTRSLDRPLYVFERSVNTNQRIEFDLSGDNKWLVSGDTEGILRIWDLLSYTDETQQFKETQFRVHNDCCNGIALHPRKTILATCSGQYHQTTTNLDDDAEPNNKTPVAENSLIMWWTGKTSDNVVN